MKTVNWSHVSWILGSVGLGLAAWDWSVGVTAFLVLMVHEMVIRRERA